MYIQVCLRACLFTYRYSTYMGYYLLIMTDDTGYARTRAGWLVQVCGEVRADSREVNVVCSRQYSVQ